MPYYRDKTGQQPTVFCRSVATDSGDAGKTLVTRPMTNSGCEHLHGTLPHANILRFTELEKLSNRESPWLSHRGHLYVA